MKRCLELGKKGLGSVSPNPMVGCVIVYEHEIIGEGYHMEFGGPHAEVLAVDSVKNKELLKAATVYVSLEPCSHHGKTPPCTDLLISSGVQRVVAGVKDPNPIVSGRGLTRLKEAGIEVVSGLMEEECRYVNRRFFINQTLSRPYVILKWAESADGYMASDGVKQISGLAAQSRVHKWRSEEDAFLVGTETLLKDDPELNTRLWKGRDPVRVAIDYSLKSEHQNLKFYKGRQRTIILNGLKDETQGNLEFVKIKDKTVDSILHALYERRIASVVIEGGSALLNSFMLSNTYDEIRRFCSKKLNLGNGLKAPKIDFAARFTEDMIDDYLMVY